MTYYITNDWSNEWIETGAKSLKAAKAKATYEFGDYCYVGARSNDLNEPVDADPTRIVALAGRVKGRWGHRADIDLLIA